MTVKRRRCSVVHGSSGVWLREADSRSGGGSFKSLIGKSFLG
uniref:Uncharacterized protein n=1 Tax=Oryza meridionalis TaxID=40149 RepID=A0A0E0DBF9_9ORYZ